MFGVLRTVKHELPMKRVSQLYETEITKSENANIRYFAVPQSTFQQTESDLESGKWLSANPANVPGFSAVSYFFGAELYLKYHVPIGLINASLGARQLNAG